MAGWKIDDDGSWSCRLPADAQEKVEAISVNERRAVRARFPATGEAVLDGVSETILEQGGGRRPVKARQELQLPQDAFDMLAPLEAEQLAAVDIIHYHKWDVTRRHPLSLDPATRTVTVEGGGMKPWNRLDKGVPFILENLPGPAVTTRSRRPASRNISHSPSKTRRSEHCLTTTKRMTNRIRRRAASCAKMLA